MEIESLRFDFMLLFHALISCSMCCLFFMFFVSCFNYVYVRLLFVFMLLFHALISCSMCCLFLCFVSCFNYVYVRLLILILNNRTSRDCLFCVML